MATRTGTGGRRRRREDSVYLIAAATITLIYTQKGKFLPVGRGRVHVPDPRHLRRAQRHDLLHGRRQSHRPPVHARWQTTDDDGHDEHAVGHGLRWQEY